MRPDITKDDLGRITLSCTFACESTERAFRHTNLRQDLRLNFCLVLTAVVGAVFFLFHDYALFGVSDQFAVLAALRSVVIVVSLAVLLMLRRCTSAARADRIIIFWGSLLAAGHAYAITTRPIAFVWHALMCIGLVYAILPVPLKQQCFMAIGYSLGVFGLEIYLGLDVLWLLPLAGAFILINGVGVLTSWQLNYRRRQAYDAWLKETRIRQELELALAEVQTLRGLLPICAWCRKIREEDQWLPFEEYVKQHTLADFTHGICPHCLGKQLGEPEYAAPWPPAAISSTASQTAALSH